MLIVPTQPFGLVGNGTGTITVSDRRTINNKPGLRLLLKQLFFNVAITTIQSLEITYDAYITVNSEPVALIVGKTGMYYINAANGDVFSNPPTQFCITYDPAISIAQKDSIDFQALLTTKDGFNWPALATSWAYMLNFAE